LADGGPAGVVYGISTGVAGTIGGVFAVIGVIVCPITSGDTALRSARLMVEDERGLHTRNRGAAIKITLILSVFVVALCILDFTVLWQYFSWLNQTLACIVLWTATVFLLRTSSNRMYSLITALPALFMTMTTTTYIIHAGQGLSLDYNISLVIGAFITFVAGVLYVREFTKNRAENE
jgi:carbon starvation protein CstA